MSFFSNSGNVKSTMPRDVLENKYKNSISNILLVLAFTVVNVVLLILNSNTYFLFSAFLPYFAVDCGMYFCGYYPDEYYYGDEVIFDKSFFAVTIAMAVIILLFYLVSWFFAKKKKIGWVIFALAFFCIDTVAMFLLTEIGADSIVDIVFHIWVIISLANGVYAYYKQKNLPDEPIVPVEEVETDHSEQTDSSSTEL